MKQSKLYKRNKKFNKQFKKMMANNAVTGKLYPFDNQKLYAFRGMVARLRGRNSLKFRKEGHK